jgi:hypothetical protein
LREGLPLQLRTHEHVMWTVTKKLSR